MNKFIFFFLFISNNLLAQDKQCFLHFNLLYEQQPLVLDNDYTRYTNKMRIDNVQFYISNITFFKNGEPLKAVIEKYNLVSSENPSSQTIDYSLLGDNSFDEITFNIGIDSSTNLSGAYGGALDPTQGMYWTWQNGYINIKIEGSSNRCPSRKNKFQFHLGGYAYPFNSLQKVKIKSKNANLININLALDEFMNQIDLAETYEVMSPSEQAVKLAIQFATIFTADEH